MRLTEKYDDNSGYGVKENYAYEQHLYIDLGAYEDCVQKLGRLEDIEEELGISLFDFFNLIKQGKFKYENEYGFIVDFNEYELKSAIEQLLNKEELE